MRRFVICTVAAFGLGLSPLTASAAQPTISHYTVLAAAPLSGVCSFDIAWSAVADVTETDFYDSTGQPIRVSFHQTETDTFAGPGRTLVSAPYTYSAETYVDAGWVNGELLKVRLPDGSLFESAGRVDLSTVTSIFIFSPDWGHSGNLGAFCAALGV